MIPKELLPPDMMNDYFIAGGWAACPAMATDIDVWVHVDITVESLQAARYRILQWLEETFWEHKPVEDAKVNSSPLDGAYGVHTLKVAVIESVHLPQPIHIMVTSATAEDQIETFDISTHAVALRYGTVLRATNWTPLTEPPRILKMTPTTPARLEKIAARYGHALTPQEVS